jgi:hypothetical protein
LVPLLPARPWCADDPSTGLKVRPVAKALGFRHLQLNGPHAFRWLLFDVDRPGAYYADDDANLALANMVMVNRENGHGHLAYLLAVPVLKQDFSGRKRPLDYLAAVERGMTNRMGADKHFSGLVVKNPIHPDWLVEFRRVEPYTLDELDDTLFDYDKRFDSRPEVQWGAGRNVTVFDELRAVAYREVLNFKRQGATHKEFRERMEVIARGLNLQFRTPLLYSEIRAIAKSTAKWVWARFSADGRRQWAKKGAAKRWAGHDAASRSEPWKAAAISRATFYRRKRLGHL